MSRFNVGDKVIWRYAPHEVTTVVETKSGPVCGILSASDTNSHWVGDDELRFPNEEPTYATGGYTGGYTGNGGAHIEKGYVIPNVDIEMIRRNIKRLSEPADKQLVDYPKREEAVGPEGGKYDRDEVRSSYDGGASIGARQEPSVEGSLRLRHGDNRVRAQCPCREGEELWVPAYWPDGNAVQGEDGDGRLPVRQGSGAPEGGGQNWPSTRAHSCDGGEAREAPAPRRGGSPSECCSRRQSAGELGALDSEPASRRKSCGSDRVGIGGSSALRAGNASDPVNHPIHYTSHPAKCQCGRGVECIQVTEHMGFSLGNALKYIWRADLKNDAIEDLRKAIWYIEREIALRERNTENNQQTKEN